MFRIDKWKNPTSWYYSLDGIDGNSWQRLVLSRPSNESVALFPLILLINNMLVSLKIGCVSSAFHKCIDCIQSNMENQSVEKRKKKWGTIWYFDNFDNFPTIFHCSNNWDYNIRMMYFTSLTGLLNGILKWCLQWILFCSLRTFFRIRVRWHRLMKPTTFQNVFNFTNHSQIKELLKHAATIVTQAIECDVFFRVIFVHSFVNMWEEKKAAALST